MLLLRDISLKAYGSNNIYDLMALLSVSQSGADSLRRVLTQGLWRLQLPGD